MKQGKNKMPSAATLGKSQDQRRKGTAQNAPSAVAKKANNTNRILILAGVAVLAVIAYWNSIGNKFTNWDEDEYIVDNLLIRSFNIKAFFTHYLSGNYHPVTELALAIEYHFWGLKESGYHLVSLLLHICNAVFVFYAVLLLSKKTEVAAVASVLFAIHPMHVESVAWAAEQKDLLYTFFFLASYICYLKYVTDSNKKLYVFSIVLFLLSLLSKAMAASLPVLLLLTDYFTGRKINAKNLLEKMPFFVLAIVLGVVAIFAQRSAHGIQEVPVYPLATRAVFACYGFVTYLYKLVLPLNLCAFYPYPEKTGAGIPSWYYFYPVLFMLVAALVFYSLRFSRKVFFGIGFFAVTVFLVLQLLPVGYAIMADRYSYIPSVGLFYLAGEGFYWLWNKKTLRLPALVFLSVAVLSFSFVTHATCATWKTGMTLWNDILSKYQNVPFVYDNRGILLLNDEKYEDAIHDFNISIQQQAYNPHAYNNRGIALSHLKRYGEAKKDFDKAIQQDSVYIIAYMNRGMALLEDKKYEEAIPDFNKSLALTPNSAEAFYNKARAEYTLGKKEAACADLQQAIKLKFASAEDAYNHLCK